MDDTYNSPLGDANPYAPESARLRRRGVAAAAYGPATTDPYKGNWAAETTRSVLARSAADYRYAPEVIARYAFGDEEGARGVARRWQGDLQRAQEVGPAVQDFSQAKDAGGFISALGYQAANMAPDVAAAALTGGVTAGLAKRGARKAAVNLAADGLEATAERTAARTAAREAAGEAAKVAAMRESGSVPAAVSKRVRGAMAGVDDQFRKESMREALAIAGRTPSTIAGIEAAGTRGFRAGATVAGIPTLSETNVERYADEGTSSADAAKLLAGTAGASLLQSFPLERLAGRFGGEAAEQIAQKGERFLPRVTKEFGKQGVAEGSQEAAQQAIQLASHAWMDENWDPLTSEEGRSSILQNAMAGFLLGGVLGAGAETARSTSGAVGSAARASKAAYGKLRDAAREQLTKLAEKARSAEKRRRAGEPMDPDDAGAPAGAGGLDLQGFFAKAKDLAGKGLDATTTAATGLKDTIAGRFKDIVDGRTQAEEIDAVADAFADEMLAMDGKGYPGQLRDPTQNRFQYKTGQQRMMMSFVDESKLDEPTAMKAAAILERLHTGKAEGLDFADLQDMRDAGLIRNSTYAAIALAGNEQSKYGAQVAEENAREYDERQARAAAGMAPDAPIEDVPTQGAMSEAMRAEYARQRQAALDEGEVEIGADGLADDFGDDVDGSNWDQGISETDAETPFGTDIERAESAKNNIAQYQQALDALSAEPESALRNRQLGNARRALEAAKADADAAERAVEARVFGKRTLNQRYGKNVIERNDKSPQTYDKKLREPGRVEMTTPGAYPLDNGRVIKTKLAVSLDSIALADANRHKERYADVPKDRQLVVGMAYAIQDLKALGHEINPDTLSPGEVNDKNGKGIGFITKADVEYLRSVVAGDTVRPPRGPQAPKAGPLTQKAHAGRRVNRENIERPYVSDDRVREMGDELAPGVDEASSFGAGPVPIGPFGGTPSQELVFGARGNPDVSQEDLDRTYSDSYGFLVEFARKHGIKVEHIATIDGAGKQKDKPLGYRIPEGRGSANRLVPGKIALSDGRSITTHVPVRLIGYDNRDGGATRNVNAGRWQSTDTGIGVMLRPEETGGNTARSEKEWNDRRKREADEAKRVLSEELPKLMKANEELRAAGEAAMEENGFETMSQVAKYDRDFTVLAAVLEAIPDRRGVNTRSKSGGSGMTKRESRAIMYATQLIDSLRNPPELVERALERRTDRLQGRDPDLAEQQRLAARAMREHGKQGDRRQAQIESDALRAGDTGEGGEGYSPADSRTVFEKAAPAYVDREKALREQRAEATRNAQESAKTDKIRRDAGVKPEPASDINARREVNTTKPDRIGTESNRTTVSTQKRGDETRVRGLATPVGQRVEKAKAASRLRAQQAYDAMRGLIYDGETIESPKWLDDLFDRVLPRSDFSWSEQRAEKRAASAPVELRSKRLAQVRHRTAQIIEATEAAMRAQHDAAGKTGEAPKLTDTQKHLIRSNVNAQWGRLESARVQALNAETPKRSTKTFGGNTTTLVDNAIGGAKKYKTTEQVQNEDVDPGAASASSESGPHNLKAEQSMLNAILKALGISERVMRLEKYDGGDRAGLKGGQYVRARRLIRMNPHIHGAERVEILMHELGHHIIWNEIAKYVEGGWDALNAMSLAEAVDTLAKGNPKLYKALRKDFDAWYASGQRSTSPTYRHLKKVTNGLSRTYSDEATAFHEWFADHIARSLAGKRQTVGIVGEFFSAIATQLRKAWQLITAMPELKPAPSVDAWVKQMLKAETAAVKAATGVSVAADTADAAVRAAAASAAGVDARDPLVVIGEAIDDMVVYVRSVLPKEERLILERMFSSHGALAQLRKFYNDHGRGDLLKRIDAAKSGMEARIAMGYIAWQQGAFNPGTEGRKALLTAQGDLLSIFGMAGDTDLAQRVLEDIASGKIERMRARDQAYSVRELEARARGTRQRALNWLAKEGPVSSALAKFWSSQYSRLHSAGVPALRHLIALVQRPQGATSDDQDRGLNPALRLKNARLHTQLHAAIKDLDDAQRGHVLDLLQRGAIAGEVAYDKKSPAIRKAVDDLRAMTGEVFDYMVAAGAINKDKRHDNFWPVTLSLTDDTAKTRLFKLYNQPEKFEKSIREFFGYWEDEGKPTEAGPGKPKTERKRIPDTESKFEDLVQRLVDGAGEFDGEMRVGASETEVDPAFKGLNHRVSQFVYEHGDEKDRHAFAKLQSKDFDEIFARYFAPAVRNAEYTRRFGGGPKNRDKLDALLAEAKKQGATKEDLELAENAIKAAIGTYGMDGSPTLNAISPALAKKLSGPRTKAFIQGAQAYQNTRLLPLALLSSLVDPMGIAVRSGGDLKETWTGFKDGIRALAKGKEGKELLAMLEEIGAGDEFLPALAAHPVFDGNENAFAKKVNEFVFKWNGMSSWVMATRIMAMTAGHKFLLKHAAAYDTDDTSRRFLDELSLTPADVQADAEKPGRVVLNDKTREALRQFVDEAILRPNSTQVPLWHSDPYMGLVTQYKAFGYAIYDQISGRVVRELNHGNYRVMLAALAYLPLALMAELLRELIQYGDEGNPRREDWGVVDYTALAAERTGLLGPQAAIAGDVKGDIGRNELPGTSQLGPTLGQAENAADAFEGRRSLGGEFEGALPASAAWKHWNDGSSEGLQRRNAA